MNIAVYLGSNNGNSDIYLDCARKTGAWIGDSGNALVYGGAESGMMGVLADAALEHGAFVTGVIPSFFTDRVHPGLTKTEIVDNMSQRKAEMIALADAFLALPGGPGTIEEISEIISAKRIGLMKKPCVIYNLNGYYDPLKMQGLKMVQEGFLTQKEYERVVFADTLEEAENALLRL